MSFWWRTLCPRPLRSMAKLVQVKLRNKDVICAAIFHWFSFYSFRIISLFPDARIQTAVINGGGILTIPACPQEKNLSIIHAKYGEGGRCQMYCVVFALCNGKRSCIIPNMEQFKKSCPGSSRKLEVRYQCAWKPHISASLDIIGYWQCSVDTIDISDLKRAVFSFSLHAKCRKYDKLKDANWRKNYHSMKSNIVNNQ